MDEAPREGGFQALKGAWRAAGHPGLGGGLQPTRPRFHEHALDPEDVKQRLPLIERLVEYTKRRLQDKSVASRGSDNVHT